MEIRKNIDVFRQGLELSTLLDPNYFSWPKKTLRLVKGSLGWSEIPSFYRGGVGAGCTDGKSNELGESVRAIFPPICDNSLWRLCVLRTFRPF